MTVKAILSVAGICVVVIGLIIEINLYGNYFIPWVWLLFPTGVLIIISAWFYLLLRRSGTISEPQKTEHLNKSGFRERLEQKLKENRGK